MTDKKPGATRTADTRTADKKPGTTRGASARGRAPSARFQPPEKEDPAVNGDGDMPTPTRIAPVLVDKIDRDERVNTRPVDEAWVRRTAKKFNLEAIGVPAVSLRQNGTFIALDGQNRVALLREVGLGNHMLTCRIFEGLSLAEEAGLFVLLNSGRAPNTMSKFLAALTAGDDTTLDIVRIVELNSFKIDRNGGDNAIMGVSTITKLYTKDLRRNKGQTPTVLNLTLSTIVNAWQHQPGVTHQAIIEGVGLMYLIHGPAINQAQLTERLASYPGGPEGLRLKAAGLASALGGSVANSVAALITEAYNKGMQSRRLPKMFQ